ncbi:hypothetical protein [Nocardia vaccinii]|uniref:hypothetical protein n=1 Tax=Nocardia vaccinii TaxID=1822 RepID=UPI000B00CA33|nr:hypothetical protein [Nocardia vaccinii]
MSRKRIPTLRRPDRLWFAIAGLAVEDAIGIAVVVDGHEHRKSIGFEFGTKPCYFRGLVDAADVGVLVASSPTHPSELVGLSAVSVEAVRVSWLRGMPIETGEIDRCSLLKCSRVDLLHFNGRWTNGQA